jgi:hypothetical protein
MAEGVWAAEDHPPHQWPVGTVAGWRDGYGCPTIWCRGEGPQRVDARAASRPADVAVADALLDALCDSPIWHDRHIGELEVEVCDQIATALQPVIAAEVSRQVAAREAEAVDAALDKVERRLRALKRVGDAATHETVIQVALTIVREVRRPAPAEVAEVPGVEAVLAAVREEVSEVVYRELGDMVNRDYLIDALMSVISHRVDPEALTQTAAPDLGPESNDSHAWLGSDR